ncbi:UNVERIFIED_CONTAM: hypothetical protein FKN15_039053 [Acipenser sinensis]
MEPAQEEADDRSELFLKGLVAELCPGCGAYGHTVAICPIQYEEEELPPQEPEEEEPVRPVSGREEPVCPMSGGEEPVHPVSGGEEPVRPVSGGEEPVRPVSRGEKLKAQTPIFFWEGRGGEAQAPQQPLFLMLKGSEEPAAPPALPPLSEELAAPPALPPLSEEPAAPPALPPLSEESVVPPALPLLSEEPTVPTALTPLSEEPAAPPEGDELLFLPPPSEGDELLANSSNPAVGGASSATRGRRTAVPASAIRGRRAAVPAPAIRGAGAGSTSCRQQLRGTLAAATLAGGSCTVDHAQGCLPRTAQGCLLLRIAWGCLLFHTGYRVRGRSGAPAAASMAWGFPPEFASRGSAAAAVASRGSAAAAVASRGSAAAAVASRGSAAAAVASRGSAAAAVASRGSAAAAVASRGSAAAAVASRGSAAAAVASQGSAAAAVAWGCRGSCFAWGRPGSCFAWGREGSCFAWGRPGSCFAWGRPGSCFAWGRPGSCFAWGHYTMAGAPRRGTAGHEERGGGQETSSPSRTFAAGDHVVGAPRRGNAGHKEGGEVRGLAPPAALSWQDSVWREPRKRELPATKNWGVPDLPPWPPPWTLCFPLFQDFETEGGGGHLGHVVLRTRRGDLDPEKLDGNVGPLRMRAGNGRSPRGFRYAADKPSPDIVQWTITPSVNEASPSDNDTEMHSSSYRSSGVIGLLVKFATLNCL